MRQDLQEEGEIELGTASLYVKYLICLVDEGLFVDAMLFNAISYP